VDHFLTRAARKLNITIHKIDQQALDALSCYHWPGNIRELQNIIERAIVLSSDQTIHLEQLPVIFSNMTQLEGAPLEVTDRSGLRKKRDDQVSHVERDLLTHYLTNAKGNVSAAARLAEIPRRTFYRMMSRHDIASNEFRNN